MRKKTSKPTARSAPVRAIRVPAALESRLPFTCHGASVLPAVSVVSYNVELKERGVFVGDRASKTAFFERIDAWRAIARSRGEDPFGSIATRDLTKKGLNRVLRVGSTDAAGIVQSAIDDFARDLVDVIERFRRAAWPAVDRIAIGGGFRQGRLGELAIGRAQSLLAEKGLPIVLQPVHHHVDEAGVVGAVHLLPSWMIAAYDSVLGVDIGGGSIRCGRVRFKRAADGQIRKTSVDDALQWEHREDQASRTAVIDELGNMLNTLIANARKQRVRLAPFVGVGCPGHIELDGRIDRGAQNLPGDWAVPRFHLPSEIARRMKPIDAQPPSVVMHNDAVVQGLSEIPRMRDVESWGILTIGTGLGNAAFRRLDIS